MIRQPLNGLLEERFHGAVNIRGIRYQILWSVNKSLSLYDANGPSSLRLEGIEDVDLSIPWILCDLEFVQIKTAERAWNWAKLKEPIASFLEVLRNNATCRFQLGFDFPLEKDIGRLAARHSLSNKDQKDIESKFATLVKEVGGTEREALELVSRLRITTKSEKQLLRELEKSVAEKFELGTASASLYLLVLAGKFLEWAEQRKKITREDVNAVRASIGEALAQEGAFQAIGRGLVSRVDWSPDARLEDFYDGRGTRLGHIVADADVKRNTWLYRIEQALKKTKACVVRAPSGQGKTALVFRYAYDNWAAEQTILLKYVRNSEEATVVSNYLQFRKSLGVPLLLIIEDAGPGCRLWAEIVRRCASLDISVLIGSRAEDWHRYGRESIADLEVLDLLLEPAEALMIFDSFKKRNRVHPDIQSGEWAFEKIEEPKLLMEFVTLITKGKMLRERLRDQIQSFHEHDGDPAKIELLRRACLAQTLGVELPAMSAVAGLTFRTDVGEAVASMASEFIRVEGGTINGLHWMRSKHLLDILHEGYPRIVDSCLDLLDLSPVEYLGAVVAKALHIVGPDRGHLVEKLVARCPSMNLSQILQVVNGIFQAGERDFFVANRASFEKANSLNPHAILPLTLDLMSSGRRVGIVAQMAEISPANSGWRAMPDIASTINSAPRGRDAVIAYLTAVTKIFSLATFASDSRQVAIFIEWCAFCNVALSQWAQLRDGYISHLRSMTLSAEDMCTQAQALFRYDPDAHREFVGASGQLLISYLKYELDLLTLLTSVDELSFSFIIDDQTVKSTNDEAVQRINTLQAILPSFNFYSSHAEWLLPLNLSPSHSDSEKRISKDYSLSQFDVRRNVVFRHLVTAEFLPDSFFAYEKLWFELRRDALDFVANLSKRLQNSLTGTLLHHVAKSDTSFVNRLPSSLSRIQPFTEEDLRLIGKEPSDKLCVVLKNRACQKWESAFSIFFSQVLEYIQDNSKSEIGRLAIFNFREALSLLGAMQNTFDVLFEDAPDYFNARTLNESELAEYASLEYLLDAWLLNPVSNAPQEILPFLKERRQRQDLAQISRVADALNGAGLATARVGRAIVFDFPLREFAIAFEVADPVIPLNSLGPVLQAVSSVASIAEFLWFVPTYQGKRFIAGAYRFAGSLFNELNTAEVTWEQLVPLEIPIRLLNTLPQLEFKTNDNVELHRLIVESIGFTDQIPRAKVLLHYPAVENRFDEAIQKRNSSRIARLCELAARKASEASAELDKKIPSWRSDQKFHIVLDALTQLSLGRFEEFIGRPDYDVNQLLYGCLVPFLL